MSSLLQTILGDAGLVQAVAELSPEKLGALVRHVGLEECGQLLALATPDQLRAFADDDLWKPREDGPGDAIDPARFALWLEVLLEHGSSALGEALEAMDEDMLAHVVSEQLSVLHLDSLTHIMSANDPLASIEELDLTDKLLSATLSHELGDYLLLSRRQDGWDALIEGLYALESSAPEVLEQLLERLSSVSLGAVAEVGLHSFLSEQDRLANDALGDRELRRETRGFVSELDARAFLGLAKEDPEQVGDDPISLRYLRRFRPAQPSAATGDPRDQSRLAELLAASGVRLHDKPVSPAALGSGAMRVRAQLRALSGSNPVRHAALMTELGFLANVLKAASRAHAVPLALVGAVHQVLALVEEGLDADASVEDEGMLRCFARGWQRGQGTETPTASD